MCLLYAGWRRGRRGWWCCNNHLTTHNHYHFHDHFFSFLSEEMIFSLSLLSGTRISSSSNNNTRRRKKEKSIYLHFTYYLDNFSLYLLWGPYIQHFFFYFALPFSCYQHHHCYPWVLGGKRNPEKKEINSGESGTYENFFLCKKSVCVLVVCVSWDGRGCTEELGAGRQVYATNQRRKGEKNGVSGI